MQLCPFSTQVTVADPKHDHAKGHNITSLTLVILPYIIYIYIYIYYLRYHLMASTKGRNSTQNTEFILILDDLYYETGRVFMNNKTRYLFKGSFQGFC